MSTDSIMSSELLLFEQLPLDEKANKKRNVLIVYIREITAASSPHSREKIHSEGLWKGRRQGRLPGLALV